MVKEKLCMQPLEKTCMVKSIFGIGWLNDGLKFSYLKSRKGSILLLQQKSSHNIARTQIYYFVSTYYLLITNKLAWAHVVSNTTFRHFCQSRWIYKLIINKDKI